MEQSNVAGVLSTNVSFREKPSNFVPHRRRCQTPAVGTTHPFGLPVDPDVYMMYMTSGGSHEGETCWLSSVAVWLCAASKLCREKESELAIPRHWHSSSKNRTAVGIGRRRRLSTSGCRAGSGCAPPAASTSTIAAPASSRMPRLRGLGQAGSQGTNVPPDEKHAAWDKGREAVRRSTSPTVKPRPCDVSSSSAQPTAAARILEARD
mmetsp:Transcript_27855/g.90028  ORF Transcript_27855/g.90028 Transcript_27855/m.90028 type:complete len:207 (-) Transcript_27855:209-829(-)